MHPHSGQDAKQNKQTKKTEVIWDVWKKYLKSENKNRKIIGQISDFVYLGNIILEMENDTDTVKCHFIEWINFSFK